MKIQLDRKQLLAALCTASKESIRYYLIGVHVIATANETRLVATNGHILSVQRQDAKGDNDLPCEWSLTIPRDVVERVKGVKGLDPWITSDDGLTWVLHADTYEFPFKPIDGKFPDFRRVIPRKTSGTPANFDAEYLMQFHKAAKILSTGRKPDEGFPVFLKQNGEDGTFVGIKGVPSYVGVIMCLKLFDDAKRGPEPEIPAWCHEALA